MRIAIVSFGSRGDVQPYVALGLGLKHAGHTVRVVTQRDSESLVRDYGLDYGAVAGDVRAMMQSEVGQQAIKPLGQLLTTLPVGPNHPGKTVGATFEIYRTGYILPHRHAAWAILHERLLEFAGFCGKLSRQQSLPNGLLYCFRKRAICYFAMQCAGKPIYSY